MSAVATWDASPPPPHSLDDQTGRQIYTTEIIALATTFGSGEVPVSPSIKLLQTTKDEVSMNSRYTDVITVFFLKTFNA